MACKGDQFSQARYLPVTHYAGSAPVKSIHSVHKSHPRSTRETLIKYMHYIYAACSSKQAQRKVWYILLAILNPVPPFP